jgi:Spy/CpxP family protein refolding chaperone
MIRTIGLYAGILLITSAVVQAQGSPVVPPVPTPAYAQLKSYLNLSDAQLQSLEDIYKSRLAAQQAIYQQISAKQKQLNQLLAGGTSDAATVGQLMIDIHNLQKQTATPSSMYRDQALRVLSADQVAKVTALVAALQLQQAAYQAVTLDLIDSPAPAVVPLSAAAMPRMVENPQP